MYIEETLIKLNICLFFVKYDELLEKYNDIWEKVKISIKKKFDSEPVYSEKYLKAKIKCYNRKISINLHKIKYQKKVLSLFVYHQF